MIDTCLAHPKRGEDAGLETIFKRHAANIFDDDPGKDRAVIGIGCDCAGGPDPGWKVSGTVLPVGEEFIYILDPHMSAPILEPCCVSHEVAHCDRFTRVCIRDLKILQVIIHIGIKIDFFL